MKSVQDDKPSVILRSVATKNLTDILHYVQDDIIV